MEKVINVNYIESHLNFDNFLCIVITNVVSKILIFKGGVRYNILEEVCEIADCTKPKAKELCPENCKQGT